MKRLIIKTLTIIIIISVNNNLLFAQSPKDYAFKIKHLFGENMSMIKNGSADIDSIGINNADDPELNHVLIYLKNDTIPLQLHGVLFSLEQTESKINVCIQNNPCCNGNIISFFWVDIYPNNKYLDTIYKISYTTSTFIPLFRQNEERVTRFCINGEESLRATPVIDDSTYFYDLRQTGNVVATLNEKTECYVIGSEMTDDGKWFFVAAVIDDSIKDPLAENNDDMMLGWLCLE